MVTQQVPTAGACIGQQVALLARYVGAIYDGVLSVFFITGAQLHLLVTLLELGNATSAELRDRLHADPSTILHHARALVHKGLVQPGPPRANRRKTYCLTRAGSARLHECHADWLRAQQRVQEILGQQLVNELRLAVDRIRAITPRPERARFNALNYYGFTDEANDVE